MPASSGLISEEAEEVDVDDLDAVPEEDQFGRTAYLEKCQELGIVPVSQVLKFLENEEMHITHYGLGLKGTMALVSALQLNTSLVTVRLPDNGIPESGVAALAQVLADSRTITELDLSGNKAGMAGAKALAGILSNKASSMRTMCLAHMQLSCKEAAPLIAALEEASGCALKSLDLSNNQLGDRAAAALSSMLATNIVLQELNLSWNKLRPKGVAVIAEGLKPNLALQVLGLAWCGAGDQGAQAMGATLKTNNGLVDVDMCGNSISPAGAVQLAEGVAASSSLAAIAVDNNDLREEGGRAMLKAVESNKGLVLVRLDNSNTSVQVRTAIDALLAPRLAAQKARQLAGL